MEISYYPAIISRSNRRYNVYFPDLPDCSCFDSTIEAAILAGEKALSAQLTLFAEQGNVIPIPGNIEAIAAFAGSLPVERFLIRGERPGRAVCIQITLDEYLLSLIDRVAQNRSVNGGAKVGQRGGVKAGQSKRALTI